MAASENAWNEPPQPRNAYILRLPDELLLRIAGQCSEPRDKKVATTCYICGNADFNKSKSFVPHYHRCRFRSQGLSAVFHLSLSCRKFGAVTRTSLEPFLKHIVVAAEWTTSPSQDAKHPNIQCTTLLKQPQLSKMCESISAVHFDLQEYVGSSPVHLMKNMCRLLMSLRSLKSLAFCPNGSFNEGNKRKIKVKRLARKLLKQKPLTTVKELAIGHGAEYLVEFCPNITKLGSYTTRLDQKTGAWEVSSMPLEKDEVFKLITAASECRGLSHFEACATWDHELVIFLIEKLQDLEYVGFLGVLEEEILDETLGAALSVLNPRVVMLAPIIEQDMYYGQQDGGRTVVGQGTNQYDLTTFRPAIDGSLVEPGLVWIPEHFGTSLVPFVGDVLTDDADPNEPDHQKRTREAYNEAYTILANSVFACSPQTEVLWIQHSNVHWMYADRRDVRVTRGAGLDSQGNISPKVERDILRPGVAYRPAEMLLPRSNDGLVWPDTRENRSWYRCDEIARSACVAHYNASPCTDEEWQALNVHDAIRTQNTFSGLWID